MLGFAPARSLAAPLLGLAATLASLGCSAGAGGGGLRLGAWNRDTRSLLASDADLKATSTLTFPQVKDHFAAGGGAAAGATSGATFPQRYFVNSELATGAHAPVFLYICGESECTANTMNVFLRLHAETFRGHMIALEHRYYGASWPTPDLTVPNLRLLSTSQAIEDLATFIRAMRKQGFDGPWITLGGSYPGSLSAYFRALHPELVVGALASSAPVRAKEDFDEYDDHVAGALGATCAAATRRVVARFEADAAASDKTALSADLAAFGLPAAAEPMPALAAYRAKVDAAFPGEQSDLTSTALPPQDTVGGRMWAWQTCKEYGYWQTALADRTRSVFSKLITLDSYRADCNTMFGSATPADVAGTNQTFFAPLAKATRILYTNGSNDPWSRLSITSDTAEQQAREVYTYVIDGASHAEDLLYPQGGDSKSLVGARQKFDGLVRGWLAAGAGDGAQGGGTGTGTGAGNAGGGAGDGGALGGDLYVALSDGAGAADVTLWASTPATLTGLELCAGDLTACRGDDAASLSFTLKTDAATGALATRHVFRANAALTPTSGAPLTLIGRDQDGRVVARRQVSLRGR